MEQIGKEKMQEIAQEVFGLYPKAKKVIVSSDGQAFVVDEGDAAAKNHALNNKYGKELALKTFLRDDAIQKSKKDGKKKAAELIAEIEASETVDAVNAILGNDERVAVKEAAEKRIAELQDANNKNAE